MSFMKVQTSAVGYRDSSMGSKSGGGVFFPKKAAKESRTTADSTKKGENVHQIYRRKKYLIFVRLCIKHLCIKQLKVHEIIYMPY